MTHRTGDPDVVHTSDDPKECACNRKPKVKKVWR